jgi:hemoglobin
LSEQESLYEQIGGEVSVRKFVNLFYDFMDTLPEAGRIRSMHAVDLSESRMKLFEYYSGWFGGPPLFVDKYGHPRLRARHNHVSIGVEDRDAWQLCLYKALAEMNFSPALESALLEKIKPMADHMRNVDEEQPLADC